MTRITVQDLRTCGVCPQARRRWFEKHGLDWKAFVRDGIDPAVARATGDMLTLIDRLEVAAKAREARSG